MFNQPTEFFFSSSGERGARRIRWTDGVLEVEDWDWRGGKSTIQPLPEEWDLLWCLLDKLQGWSWHGSYPHRMKGPGSWSFRTANQHQELFILGGMASSGPRGFFVIRDYLEGLIQRSLGTPELQRSLLFNAERSSIPWSVFRGVPLRPVTNVSDLGSYSGAPVYYSRTSSLIDPWHLPKTNKEAPQRRELLCQPRGGLHKFDHGFLPWYIMLTADGLHTCQDLIEFMELDKGLRVDSRDATVLSQELSRLANSGCIRLHDEPESLPDQLVWPVATSAPDSRMELLQREYDPFRPLRIQRDWVTSAVAGILDSISGENDFGLLPVLADALADAGCTDDGLLAHCRSNTRHVDYCWVVDSFLHFSQDE